MKELKESNPVQLAEYCVNNKIDDEPAMAWWVPYTLKKKVHIVSAINQRVKKTTHKYGVKVPKTLRDAYRLDEENKNTVWRDAVKKEMDISAEVNPFTISQPKTACQLFDQVLETIAK